MKTCTKCKTTKELSEFTKEKHTFKGSCKKCKALEAKEYRKTKNGLFSSIYNHQISNSKKRCHRSPSYKKEELKDWLFSQKLFNTLYDEWVKSNYDTNLIPSIDRKDDFLPYSIDNIQLTTWKENNNKYKTNRTKALKIVRKLNKDGSLLKEYSSIKEANSETNIDKSSIIRCCKNKQNTAGGYLWKYKEENNEGYNESKS